MIRAIAKRGVIIGVLALRPRSGAEAVEARLKRDQGLRNKFSDPFERAAGQRSDSSVWGTDLDLENIDRVIQIVGIDHIASHCTKVPQWHEFTETLLRHGYSEESTKKILGENALRLLRQTV